MIDHYDWAGGREAMLRFGPADGPVVVAALPLFEEANRTRAFMVTILRDLAERGIASILPDLPGQGESLITTRDLRIADLRTAFDTVAAAAGARAFSLAIRSAALLDFSGVVGRYHFAPIDGRDLIREIDRAARAAEIASRGNSEMAPNVAGNVVSADFLSELVADPPASNVAVRTARLESDARPADVKLPGPPLWRRAEPDNDAVLAALLADDIAGWVRTCAD